MITATHAAIATAVAAGALLQGSIGVGFALVLSPVLIYQHHPGPVLRSTIAMCFFIGEVMSLVLLAATGRLHTGEIEAAAWLLPALGMGAPIRQMLHRQLDGRKLRVAMVGFAVPSGAACLV